MKTAVVNKLHLLLIVFAAACAVAAAWWQMPIMFLLPPAIVLFYVLVQHPPLLLYLLMASIPWSVEYNLTETLGTDFPDEQLMWLGAGAALLLLAHRHRSIEIKKIHPLLWILLAQLLWTAVTVVCSTQPLLSLKYLLAKSWYLLCFLVLPLYYWKNEAVLRRSVLMLLLSMFCFVLLALLRHAQLGFRFENINNALAPFYRNHVNYSALLVLTLPLVWFHYHLKAGNKTLMVCLAVIMLTALYFSYARGAWLALVAAAIAFLLLKKGWLLRSFFSALLLVFVAVGWLGTQERYLRFAHDYQSTVFHTDFKDHLVATYQLKDLSTAERYHRWIAGWRMAADSWQTGFGPNTFYNHYKAYTVPAFKTWVSRNEERSTVHNYFLLLLTEQGIIGLLLFLLLLFVLLYTLERSYREEQTALQKRTVAVLAMMLTMIVVVNCLSDLIETDKVGSIFYACIAVLILIDNGQRRQPLMAKD